MRTLDQPVALRCDSHSPSLGAQIFLHEGPVARDGGAVLPTMAWAVTDVRLLAVEQRLVELTTTVEALRADLAARTWVARRRRLWQAVQHWWTELLLRLPY